jgi:16S rRNA processing protein RimM
MGTGGAADRDLVCVGRIGGVHGVRGQVRLTSYTDDPLSIGAYGPLTDRTGSRRYVVRVKHMAKGSVIAEIEGIRDRDAAAALKGVELFVTRSQLPPPTEDEFYRADLVGLAAELTDGTRLGTVVAVEDFGAGDVLDVARTDATSLMVPFTRAVVPVVDLENRRVVIDPPPGLLSAPDAAGEEDEGAAP